MRTKDFDKWLDTILEWTDKTEKKVLEKCNWVTKKVLYTTIQFSPTQPQARFSKGTFIGNWVLSSNGTKSFSEALRDTKEGKRAKVDAFLTPDYFKTNRHIYMTNTTPYADKVEYMGWVFTESYKPVAMTDSMMKTIKL